MTRHKKHSEQLYSACDTYVYSNLWAHNLPIIYKTCATRRFPAEILESTWVPLEISGQIPGGGGGFKVLAARKQRCSCQGASVSTTLPPSHLVNFKPTNIRTARKRVLRSKHLSCSFCGELKYVEHNIHVDATEAPHFQGPELSILILF